MARRYTGTAIFNANNYNPLTGVPVAVQPATALSPQATGSPAQNRADLPFFVPYSPGDVAYQPPPKSKVPISYEQSLAKPISVPAARSPLVKSLAERAERVTKPVSQEHHALVSPRKYEETPVTVVAMHTTPPYAMSEIIIPAQTARRPQTAPQEGRRSSPKKEQQSQQQPQLTARATPKSNLPPGERPAAGISTGQGHAHKSSTSQSNLAQAEEEYQLPIQAGPSYLRETHSSRSSRAGSRATSQPPSRIGSRRTSPTASQAGSRAASRAGSRVGSRRTSPTASQAGSRVASRAASRSASRVGSRRVSPVASRRNSVVGASTAIILHDAQQSPQHLVAGRSASQQHIPFEEGVIVSPDLLPPAGARYLGVALSHRVNGSHDPEDARHFMDSNIPLDHPVDYVDVDIGKPRSYQRTIKQRVAKANQELYPEQQQIYPTALSTSSSKAHSNYQSGTQTPQSRTSRSGAATPRRSESKPRSGYASGVQTPTTTKSGTQTPARAKSTTRPSTASKNQTQYSGASTPSRSHQRNASSSNNNSWMQNILPQQPSQQQPPLSSQPPQQATPTSANHQRSRSQVRDEPEVQSAPVVATKGQFRVSEAPTTLDPTNTTALSPQAKAAQYYRASQQSSIFSTEPIVVASPTSSKKTLKSVPSQPSLAGIFSEGTPTKQPTTQQQPPSARSSQAQLQSPTTTTRAPPAATIHSPAQQAAISARTAQIEQLQSQLARLQTELKDIHTEASSGLSTPAIYSTNLQVSPGNNGIFNQILKANGVTPSPAKSVGNTATGFRPVSPARTPKLDLGPNYTKAGHQAVMSTRPPAGKQTKSAAALSSVAPVIHQHVEPYSIEHPPTAPHRHVSQAALYNSTFEGAGMNRLNPAAPAEEVRGTRKVEKKKFIHPDDEPEPDPTAPVTYLHSNDSTLLPMGGPLLYDRHEAVPSTKKKPARGPGLMAEKSIPFYMESSLIAPPVVKQPKPKAPKLWKI